jgi:hypothetical protein
VFLATNAALHAQSGAESRNMVLVGHNDLNGNGDGGEGLEAPERCLSVIDVTKLEAPRLINQIRSAAPGVTRCNSPLYILRYTGNVPLD